MNTKYIFVPLIICLCCVLVGMLMPVNASATVFNFDLSVGNTSGSIPVSSLPSPYASVSVDFTSSTVANITFTGDTFSTALFPNGQYLLGNVGLNLNKVDSNLVASNFAFSSGTFPFGSTTSFTQGTGSQQFDGFGVMNFFAQDNSTKGGFNEGVHSVSFTLTDTTENWATLADLLIANDKGAFAAAHIYAWDGNTQVNNGAITTGFAANGGAKVPEPSSLMLLGAGLMGLGLFGRKKIKK